MIVELVLAFTTIFWLNVRGQLPVVVYVIAYVFAANVGEPKLPVAGLLIPVPLHVPPGVAAVRVAGRAD